MFLPVEAASGIVLNSRDGVRGVLNGVNKGVRGLSSKDNDVSDSSVCLVLIFRSFLVGAKCTLVRELVSNGAVDSPSKLNVPSEILGDLRGSEARKEDIHKAKDWVEDQGETCS
jgi:hypothetical protein